MSEPPITTLVGQDLYDAVDPLTFADESLGYPLANYVDANGLMLDEEARLVRPDDQGNDGWSAFADPARCPPNYLFTLAQWAGVRYPRRMAEADLRTLITHAPGLWRGTKTAILASVHRYLAPGGQLWFEERADGDPYKLRIYTYTYDTLDQAALERELLAVVPAGLIVDFEVRAGQTYQMVATRYPTYADVAAAYPTYADMAADIPKG